MISFSRPLFLILCLAASAASPPLMAQETPEKQSKPEEMAPAEPSPPEAPAPLPMPPPPMKPIPLDIPMEAFGTANPDCLEWTDACRTCARDAENMISCSTPGIACLPEDITCKKTRKK